MKNLILLLLIMPVFASGQFGLKKGQVDLVIGYDYGGRMGFKKKEENSNYTYSSLQTLRFGTNIGYSISEKWLFVSGLRFASRLSNDETEYWGQGINALNELVVIRKRNYKDFFVEIPLILRRDLKGKHDRNKFFIEGGLQFNIYAISYWRSDFIDVFFGERVDSIKDVFTDGSFRGVSIVNNISIGWETPMKNGTTYFLQTVGRIELLTANFDNKNAYHFGIETGVRF